MKLPASLKTKKKDCFGEKEWLLINAHQKQSKKDLHFDLKFHAITLEAYFSTTVASGIIL